MSEGSIGLTIFLASSIVSAVTWHTFVRRFWLAVVAAAITSVLVTHLFLALFPGEPNKFYAVAVAFSAVYALAISFGVGVPFWFVRRRRKRSHAP